MPLLLSYLHYFITYMKFMRHVILSQYYYAATLGMPHHLWSGIIEAKKMHHRKDDALCMMSIYLIF